MPKLILFDIDGTLLDSGGAGIKALNNALEDLSGVRDGFAGIDCAGKTDKAIIKEALSRCGLEPLNGSIEDFILRYVGHLRKTVHNDRAHVKVGVQALLQRLSRESDMSLGLLTGNVEPGARIKLERFYLNGFFPAGAFGSDEEDRNLLLPIAVRRFLNGPRVSFDYSDCVVIGDTPRDVTCAHVHGASSIAVATGPYSVQDLAKTQANLVIDDLSETEKIVDWIAEL
jgi:phosphoglycolate phosphatase